MSYEAGLVKRDAMVFAFPALAAALPEPAESEIEHLTSAPPGALLIPRTTALDTYLATFHRVSSLTGRLRMPCPPAVLPKISEGPASSCGAGPSHWFHRIGGWWCN